MSYFSCNVFKTHNSFSAKSFVEPYSYTSFCRQPCLHTSLQMRVILQDFPKAALHMEDQWVTKDKLVEKHYN